jgi:class 3 adenylate cyclase
MSLTGAQRLSDGSSDPVPTRRSGQTVLMADLPVPDSPIPPLGGTGAMAERVADADRDRTVTQLRESVVEGRLTLDEFSERVGSALQAKTRGDLLAVLADLPEVRPTADRLPEPGTGGPRKKGRWHVAVMSGHSTKGRWRVSGKTNAVAVMGGCDMDLRQAEIEGPEVEITAVAFWGGIDITVPEGFEVELRGFSFMGGRDLKLRDVPIVPGSPRIVVHAFAVMGGIDVKSRPNRSGKRLAKRAARRALPAEPTVDPDPGQLAAVGQDIRTELPADGTVTILFCDMVDYAGMTERLGDQASREVLRQHHRIVRDAVARHGGREISVQGDGFMVAFGGVARALRCAIDVQRAFHAYVPTDDGEPIAVHIGVHTGDAVDEGDDYLGHTVIVASRLADAAGAGEILVSSLSEQLVPGSGEFRFDGLRETRLKGLARAQMSATLAWAE